MIRNSIEPPSSDQILETLFLPQNLDSLRRQHKRYANIQKAHGKKDEIGIIGYLNTVLIMGLGISAMKLIDQENELGLAHGD